MSRLSSGLMALVGLINLAPAVGVVSAERIASAYGVTVNGADMSILLRHRAVLFGIVGGITLAGAIHAPLRWPGILTATTSMAAFVVLTQLTPDYGPALRRIVVADIVGLGRLALAVVAEMAGR